MSILIYMLKKINEWKDRFSVPTFTWLEWTRNSHFETLNLLDRCQHLSKCASTPPLIQQQSSDNYLGLNLGKGRGRYAVAQMLTCHWSKLFMAAQNIIDCDFTLKISLIPYNRDRNFYLLSHSSPPLPPPPPTRKIPLEVRLFQSKLLLSVFSFFSFFARGEGESKLEKEIEILNPNQSLGQNSNADITEAINLQLHTVPLHQVKSHQPKQMHWIFSPKEETIKRYWRLFPTFW